MIGGHGHVRPRPDGARARCGGPGLCAACNREQAALGAGNDLRREDELPAPLDAAVNVIAAAIALLDRADHGRSDIDVIVPASAVYALYAAVAQARKAIDLKETA